MAEDNLEEPSFPEHADLPLRDRLPDYVAIWGVGGVAAALLGAVINGFEGAGYSLLFLGLAFMMFGGATGGGYTSWGPGAMARMFGRSIEDEDPEYEHRLRQRLRPERNPQAFWSVVGGLGYVTLGFFILS